jgi:cold shock protein
VCPHGPRCHNQLVARKRARQLAVDGTVRWFAANEGWGVIDAPEVPGGCFVHFSSIEMPGYRELRSGQRVRFTFERPGFLQDGYAFRALAVTFS